MFLWRMKMKRSVLLYLITAGLFAAGCSDLEFAPSKQSQTFSHNVYFTLNDTSAEKVENLIDDCYTYLKDHPGVIFFAAGQRSPDHNRDVNIQDFQVSLTIVFDSVQAQNLYQTAPDHLEFIERNKNNWRLVRVFDSLVKK
ncbi:MAG: Dabb family protein [Chitinivibrionales bacterium]|nr:Dabb family protein [Chitinivibrionales bacterium]